MIKKSIFEEGLVQGMRAELHKQASGEIPNLVKAGECLHAALEILEEAGLQSIATHVFNVLEKLAAGTKHVQKIPSMQHLLNAGLTEEDLKNFSAGQYHAKVKINSILRRMGLSDDEIKNFIGPHNFLTPEDISSYVRLLDMIKNPTKPIGQIIQMKSIKDQDGDSQDGRQDDFDYITFKSIASKSRRPRRPDMISDRHTKGLTPEKEVKNYERYGWPFNMADDGAVDDDISYAIDALNADFDKNFSEALGVNNADELSIDDIMNIDIEQPLSFENDWTEWEKMRDEKSLIPEVPAEDDDNDEELETVIMDDLPVLRSVKIKDSEELGDQDITDADDNNLLEVSDPESTEDFEDEVSFSK